MPVKLFPSDPPLLKDCAVVDSPDESTTMATNKEVKTWVSEEVRKAVDEAIDSFKPHGWRKVTHALREWGLVATVLAAPIALLGIAAAAWYFGFSEIGKNSEFRGKTGQRLTDIEKRLDGIDQKLLAQVVTYAGSDPTLSTSQERAKDALLEAKQQSIRIPKKVIEQTGKRFMDVAHSNPAVWNIAVDFLEYRTFLNSSDAPPLEPAIRVPTYKFGINLRPNPAVIPTSEHPVWAVQVSKVGGGASPEQSARLETLSQPNATGVGSRYVLVEGKEDSVVLDGAYMKNVII